MCVCVYSTYTNVCIPIVADYVKLSRWISIYKADGGYWDIIITTSEEEVEIYLLEMGIDCHT